MLAFILVSALSTSPMVPPVDLANTGHYTHAQWTKNYMDSAAMRRSGMINPLLDSGHGSKRDDFAEPTDTRRSGMINPLLDRDGGAKRDNFRNADETDPDETVR